MPGLEPRRGQATLEHPDDVLAVAWDPAGLRLATACEDKKARVYFFHAGSGDWREEARRAGRVARGPAGRGQLS